MLDMDGSSLTIGRFVKIEGSHYVTATYLINGPLGPKISVICTALD